MNYPFRRTCRQVAELILAREDRALAFPERLAVRIHFLVCQACPRFERQVTSMHQAMQAWSAYRETEDEEA